MTKALKVAIVTNIPAPYRVPVFERLAKFQDCELHLVYCSGSEPDRNWAPTEGAYAQHDLKPNFFTVAGRYIHVNPDVWSVLGAMKPDVIITTGYNPTHLLAFLFAMLHRVPHVAMTDGTAKSEAGFSWAHRLLRRLVLRASRAFVGPSDGAFELFTQYGVSRTAMFKSHLCADNDAFEARSRVDKAYDLLFCGRFVEIKNPLFAMELAQRVSKVLGRKVSIAYLGAGELEPDMRARADSLKEDIDVRFLGFAQTQELPEKYGAARVFIFPTSWDPWGVVANEACAAGLPVVVTPEAGAANELIVDGLNGYVMPLEMDRWVDACVTLLNDPEKNAHMGDAGRLRVKQFSYDAAAQGLMDAVRFAVREVP